MPREIVCTDQILPPMISSLYVRRDHWKCKDSIVLVTCEGHRRDTGTSPDALSH
jgi:hypothetical protein